MFWSLSLALAVGTEAAPAPISSGQIESIEILAPQSPAESPAPEVPAPAPAPAPAPVPRPVQSEAPPQSAAPAAPHELPALQPAGEQTPSTPLTLARALRLARENNLDLRIGHELLDRAAILSSKAWGVLLPTISVNLAATYFDKAIVLDFSQGMDPAIAAALPPGSLPDPLTIQRQDRVDLQGRFEWTLINGRAFPLLMNAYAAVDVAGLRYAQAERTLQTVTTLSYFTALGAQRQVEVQRRALAAAREHLRRAKMRVEVGDALEVEAVRSETAEATAEQGLLQAENGARQAILTLATLIGTVELDSGDAPDYRLERPEGSQSLDAADHAGTDAPAPTTMEQAIAERLDLKQRRLELGMATRSRGEVWTRFLPAVVAAGLYAWSNDQGFSGDHVNWNLSLALRWTVFSGGRDYWTLQQSGYDVNAAALVLEKTRQSIAREVREAELNLASAEAGLRIAKQRVSLAQRSAAMIRAQYDVGVATQLDLIDANRQLADAETAATLAQLQADIGRVNRQQTIYAPALR